MTYIKSVLGGIIGAIVILFLGLLSPILALIFLMAGLFGLVKVNC